MRAISWWRTHPGETEALWSREELLDVRPRLTGAQRHELARHGARLDVALRRRRVVGVTALMAPVAEATEVVAAHVRAGVAAEDLIDALDMRHARRARVWVAGVVASRTHRVR